MVTQKEELRRLREDIKRLSEEIAKKDALVSDLIEISHRQSLHISSLNAALQETITGDPSTCPSPCSSTPRPQTSHRTNKTKLGSTCLNLTNRFSVLAVDSPVAAVPAPALSNVDPAIHFPALRRSNPDPPSAQAIGSDHLPQGSSRAASNSQTHPVSTHSTSSESRQPHKKGEKSSARRNIVKEAVRRRSSGPSGLAPVLSLSPTLHAPSPPLEVPRPEQTAAQPVAPRSSVASRPQHSASREVSPRSSPAAPRPQQAAVRPVISDEDVQQQPESTAVGAGPEPVSQPVALVSPPSSPHGDVLECNPRPAHQPTPLFPTTTLIIGDSIIRHVRFFNAITHCFPGATVSRLTEKIPGILQSMPPSVHRVIIHVGTNDISKRQSELTKQDFKKLLSVLRPWIFNGIAVFVSGPLPALNRGDEHFSRTFHLNNWLRSACTPLFNFIDNFNLFMDRPTHFGADGLHLNWRGSRLLTKNFLLKVHHSTAPARD